jgi:hypothetical protein
MISSLIASILFSLFFAILLAYAFRRRGPGPFGGILFMFIIIFMFTWAIGSWLAPSAQVFIRVPWLVYLLIAMIIMLLMGTLIPPSREGSQIISKADVDKMVRQEKKISDAQITIGVFFWIMIFILFLLVILKLLE